jgi:hypothetical protein
VSCLRLLKDASVPWSSLVSCSYETWFYYSVTGIHLNAVYIILLQRIRTKLRTSKIQKWDRHLIWGPEITSEVFIFLQLKILRKETVFSFAIFVTSSKKIPEMA